MDDVLIYTDGACSGNPGPGGWAAVLHYRKHEKQISGGFVRTTNGRMELYAVIMALSTLKVPCGGTLYTDAAYVVNAINKGWLKKWQSNGWRRTDKRQVHNVDLWEKLVNLLYRHDVRFVWVKGHAGNEFNNVCDKLAVAASRKKDLPEDYVFAAEERRIHENQ